MSQIAAEADASVRLTFATNVTGTPPVAQHVLAKILGLSIDAESKVRSSMLIDLVYSVYSCRHPVAVC